MTQRASAPNSDSMSVRTPKQRSALRILTKAREHLGALNQKELIEWDCCDDPLDTEFVRRGRRDFILVHWLVYEDELLIETDYFEYVSVGDADGVFVKGKQEQREALYVEPALQVLAAAMLPALMKKVVPSGTIPAA